MTTENLPTIEAEAKGLISWEERMKALVQEQSATEKPLASFISTRAGVLSYAGSPIANNRLDVVVLESAHENHYYESSFDADNPSNPVCFALSLSGEDMRPHPDSEKPQAESCAACPWNSFGTADKGKGKGCKEIRRLALVLEAATDNEEALLGAEIAMLKIPVTSVKYWREYKARLLKVYKLPTLGLVTTIAPQPDPKTQFKITFTPGPRVQPEIINALFQKREMALTSLLTPYERNPPPTAASGKAKKF